jgi:hypothetical protein
MLIVLKLTFKIVLYVFHSRGQNLLRYTLYQKESRCFQAISCNCTLLIGGDVGIVKGLNNKLGMLCFQHAEVFPFLVLPTSLLVYK